MEDVLNYLLEEPAVLALGASASFMAASIKLNNMYGELDRIKERREYLDNYAEGYFQANSNEELEYNGHQVPSTHEGCTELKKMLEENENKIEYSDRGFLVGVNDALNHSR